MIPIDYFPTIKQILSEPLVYTIPVNQQPILVQIGCQYDFPNMIMYSGGFLVYYK